MRRWEEEGEGKEDGEGKEEGGMRGASGGRVGEVGGGIKSEIKSRV